MTVFFYFNSINQNHFKKKITVFFLCFAATPFPSCIDFIVFIFDIFAIVLSPIKISNYSNTFLWDILIHLFINISIKFSNLIIYFLIFLLLHLLIHLFIYLFIYQSPYLIQERLSNVPLLVMANKQDLLNALSPAEVIII